MWFSQSYVDICPQTDGGAFKCRNKGLLSIAAVNFFFCSTARVAEAV